MNFPSQDQLYRGRISYHVVSALQEQQENWIGKVLLFVGNTKLEGKDETAWIKLMSCVGDVKSCQALIEAFPAEMKLKPALPTNSN